MTESQLIGTFSFDVSKIAVPHFNLVQVSDESKKAIFERHVPGLLLEQETAAQVISRVKELHPPAADILALKTYNVVDLPFKILLEQTFGERTFEFDPSILHRFELLLA